MKRLLHIVDSRDYITTNCFQHQLYDAFNRLNDWNVCTISYDELGSLPIATGAFDRIVSCLKQRTLFKHAEQLKNYLGDAEIVVYDQDPWESFNDDSPYKGSYDHIASHLNVRTFAVTTKAWADFLSSRGYRSKFVKMWVMRKYCDINLTYDERQFDLAFIGSLHPHRRLLFNELNDNGINVSIMSQRLDYHDYMKALSKIRIFIHNEDKQIIVDKASMNLRDGLWIKDVEAAARGCFIIRNDGLDSTSYFHDFPRDKAGNTVLRLYDSIESIPSIIDDIKKIDPIERLALMNRTVEYIKMSDIWLETASTIIS